MDHERALSRCKKNTVGSETKSTVFPFHDKMKWVSVRCTRRSKRGLRLSTVEEELDVPFFHSMAKASSNVDALDPLSTSPFIGKHRCSLLSHAKKEQSKERDDHLYSLDIC